MRLAISVTLLMAACASRALPVDVVQSRRRGVLAELDGEIAQLALSCHPNVWVAVLPTNAQEFSVRCVRGQLEIRVSDCSNSDAVLRARIAQATDREGFAVAPVYPEHGCTYFSSLTEGDSTEIGARAVRLVRSIFGLTDDHAVLFERMAHGKAS